MMKNRMLSQEHSRAFKDFKEFYLDNALTAISLAVPTAKDKLQPHVWEFILKQNVYYKRFAFTFEHMPEGDICIDYIEILFLDIRAFFNHTIAFYSSYKNELIKIRDSVLENLREYIIEYEDEKEETILQVFKFDSQY